MKKKAIMAENSIFRRPIWKQKRIDIVLATGSLVFVLGILEIADGWLEFSLSEIFSLANIGVGVGLIALGISMLYPMLDANSNHAYFTDLAAWLEALLTSPDSPLVSKANASATNPKSGSPEQEAQLMLISAQLRQIQDEIGKMDQKIVASITDLRNFNDSVLSRRDEIPPLSSEIKALKLDMEHAKTLLSDPESPLLSRFREAEAEVHRLRKKELSHLKRDLSRLAKQVKKIEAWNK